MDPKTIEDKKSNLLKGANIDCIHIRVLQRLHSMSSLSFIQRAEKTTVHDHEKNGEEICVDESAHIYHITSTFFVVKKLSSKMSGSNNIQFACHNDETDVNSASMECCLSSTSPLSNATPAINDLKFPWLIQFKRGKYICNNHPKSKCACVIFLKHSLIENEDQSNRKFKGISRNSNWEISEYYSYKPRAFLRRAPFLHKIFDCGFRTKWTSARNI